MNPITLATIGLLIIIFTSKKVSKLPKTSARTTAIKPLKTTRVSTAKPKVTVKAAPLKTGRATTATRTVIIDDKPATSLRQMQVQQSRAVRETPLIVQKTIQQRKATDEAFAKILKQLDENAKRSAQQSMTRT